MHESNNVDEQREQDTIRMRPRARLISLIGEELISDERVGVVELVKNAYDADATEVNVVFEVNDAFVPNRLIVSDNGHGMNIENVIKGWFEPGTITKKKNSRSPSGRLYQGAKGVGRFAAARLGIAMFMETKTVDASHGVTALLEWGNFDDDSYLDQIEMTYEKTAMPNRGHGTVLTIEGVNEKKIWEEDDFKNLQYRLSRLISPFDEIGDFKINLVVPSFPDLSGHVESHPLTKKPKYTLKGQICSRGYLNADFHLDGMINKNYTNHKLSKSGEIVGCGAFEFEIRAWDRDRDGLSPLMLEYDMNLSGVRKTLDVFCGVSIYRDGFRVHPYGEVGDDWLSLDNRSRQNPTTRLAKNQVIASIRTSRETNPELKDRTTREGLVHTAEFEQLKEWFERVLSVLENERYSLRPREDARPEYTTTLFEAFDMSDVVKEATSQLGVSHPVTKLVKVKDADIREGVKKLQAHYSRVLLAAGLGQLVDLVIHEIGAPLGRINREIIFIRKTIEKLKIDHEISETLTKSFTSTLGWLEQIGNLRARLDPKTAGKRGRATSFDVTEEVLGNLNLYENLIRKQNLKVEFTRPNNPLIVHMPQSILGQIVANLIDNSIYWLTRHYGDGNGGLIRINIVKVEHGFTIEFSDNGAGIPEHDREKIFEQYYSLKPNGMGLGLFIARQVIEPYGKIIYRDDGDLPGVLFEVSFLQNVGL
ncbi:MAG: ATP-binding protein [Gammaproteobacteria bacterium]|nr:ATP-binding protein [Gammaproteobacteria bacterium]